MILMKVEKFAVGQWKSRRATMGFGRRRRLIKMNFFSFQKFLFQYELYTFNPYRL